MKCGEGEGEGEGEKGTKAEGECEEEWKTQRKVRDGVIGEGLGENSGWMRVTARGGGEWGEGRNNSLE